MEATGGRWAPSRRQARPPVPVASSRLTTASQQLTPGFRGSGCGRQLPSRTAATAAPVRSGQGDACVGMLHAATEIAGRVQVPANQPVGAIVLRTLTKGARAGIAAGGRG